MSYRICAVIEDKETGEKSSYQLFGNHEFPPSFREWVEEQGIEIDEDGCFGVKRVDDGDVLDASELVEAPVEVDPSELLDAVCKVSEDEYLRMREEGKDPLAMPYAYPGYEPSLSLPFGQATMSLLDTSYALNWLGFLRWGQDMGVYSCSGIYPPFCLPGWEERLSIGICGW